MRVALSVAALAVGALAVPFKRELVVDYDMVVVTKVVTVTAGQPHPTEVAKAQQIQPVSSVVQQAQPVSSVVQQVTTTSLPPPPPPPPASTPAPAPVISLPSIEIPKFSVPAPSAPSNPSPPLSFGDDYKSIVVGHHNLHRRNHSVADLEWDDGLAASAATIAASCVYAHNVDVNGGGYGQNIAAGVAAANVSAVITDLFYNGEEPYFAPNYGAEQPDMSGFEKWGHFSQIVWKDTTHVGCATQYCPGGLGNVGSGVAPHFTVCNYKNPGNYQGQYGTNVLRPQGYATANWNSGL